MSEERTVSVNQLVTLAAVGLFGFLANDWASNTAAAPKTVEQDVREIMALTLAPIARDIENLASDFDRQATEVRNVQAELRNRVGQLESRSLVEQSQLQLLEERVERIGQVLRNSVTVETE